MEFLKDGFDINTTDRKVLDLMILVQYRSSYLLKHEERCQRNGGV